MSYKERIKTLRTEVQRLTNEAKTLYADLEAKGDKATGEERTKLNALIDDGTAKRAELVRLEDLERSDELVNQPQQQELRSRNQDQRQRAPRTRGEIVVASDQFKAASQRVSEGRMERVSVPSNLRAVYGSTGAAGGSLVDADFRPEIIDIARQRPFTALDAINIQETGSDAVEYVVMDTRTNSAAVVPEYTGGNFGLKPESNITFDLKTAAVKTLATWIAASRQILSDAPRLRSTIDTELEYMVRYTLEEEIVTGDGSGNHFTGMWNWTGVQTRVMSGSSPSGRGQTTADTKMITLRRAITDIRLEFYEANAVMLNPIDSEAIEIKEYNGNRYMNAFDPVAMRIWRTRVVETQALDEFQALVGNFTLAATLWDRMQMDIRVGEPLDFFLRNAVAVLGEIRAAFAVTRPKAIEKVTLAADPA